MQSARVARMMRSMELRAKAARKFKVTTDSNHKEADSAEPPRSGIFGQHLVEV